MSSKIKTIYYAGSTAINAINGLYKQIDLFIKKSKEIEITFLSHNVVYGQSLDQDNEFTASAIIIYEQY